ncbi:hypothetical protein PG988_015489 [Apiospora saccharicola]
MFRRVPNPEQVISPTAKSSTAMMEAASKTSSVKRFVHTSPLVMTKNEFHEAVGITPSSWALDITAAVARHRPRGL